MLFVIEDKSHEEHLGEFISFETAMAELRRRAAIAWDQHPNRAPCTSWQTCGREYMISEDDTATKPRTMARQTSVLNISARGLDWVKAPA